MHDFDSYFQLKGENIYVCAVLRRFGWGLSVSRHCNEVDKCINTLRGNKQMM